MRDHLLCPRMETEVSGRKEPKVMQGGVAVGRQQSLLLASCFYQGRAAFLGKYKARWEGGARNHCLFRGAPEAEKLRPPQRAVTLAHPCGHIPAPRGCPGPPGWVSPLMMTWPRRAGARRAEFPSKDSPWAWGSREHQSPGGQEPEASKRHTLASGRGQSQ